MQRFALLFAVVGFVANSFAYAADKPAVVRSAKSGFWSNGATWEGGQTPANGVKVQIRPEHTVTYDVKAADEMVIRSLHIAGTLSFATDKSTQLNVGLLKIEATDSVSEEGFDCDAHIEEADPNVPRASLLVGTPEQPVAAGQQALIRLVYIEGMKKESCPAIVCCGGRMDFHGAPLSRTWVKLGASAAKGAKDVTLAEAVSGWKVGDKIVLTATNTEYRKEYFSEERTIAALDSTKLTLNEPQGFRGLHQLCGVPPPGEKGHAGPVQPAFSSLRYVDAGEFRRRCFDLGQPQPLADDSRDQLSCRSRLRRFSQHWPRIFPGRWDRSLQRARPEPGNRSHRRQIAAEAGAAGGRK
ncbi:MAG: G8 domain-containing protein [Planctomycetales bacterium]|nr:G8 domain-containing protein [Planctomycetales bacterium]